MTHRCGGTLVSRNVLILDEKPTMFLAYLVSGFRCDRCQEDVIDRNTALEIQGSQTPTVSWRPREGDSIFSTRLKEGVVFELSASASTKIPA